jgi:hypothetical protein
MRTAFGAARDKGVGGLSPLDKTFVKQYNGLAFTLYGEATSRFNYQSGG